MNKIKVLHISQATGGIKRHVIDIVSKMDRARFEVSGACPPQDLIKGVSSNKESFVEAFEKAGVKVYPLKMYREIKPFQDLSAFRKIYTLIKYEKFDVVHTHSSKAGFLGRIAARLAGVPVIVHTPNSFAFDRPYYMAPQKVFYMLLEKFAGFFCDKIMAVCEDEKNLAVRLGVMPARKIVLISNTINTPGINFNIDVPKKRRELGIGESERVVILVGRLAAQKAPLDFVRAAERVLKVRQDVKFLVLGDGPLYEKTARLIRRRGLSDYMKLLGWRNDSTDLIAVSDVFVLSSLWEVLPNHSLLDAMMLGKPMVITSTCGAKDVVVNNFNGYVVPAGNYKALSSGISRLLDLPPDKLREWGRHSRELFDKRPKLENVVKIIQDTYLDILSRKGRDL